MSEKKDPGDIFLNIIILYNPNYQYNKKTTTWNQPGVQVLGSTFKTISLINQFKAFYYSIKKNLKVAHQISIVHKDPFNEKDLEILNNLEVDLLIHNPPDLYHGYDSDEILRPITWSRYGIETKTKGTHRLIAETDMLMLQNPDFDWDMDFQFNYDCNFFPKEEINNVINKYNLKPLSNLYNYNLPQTLAYHYNIGKLDYKSIPPHINNGLVLIKENISINFYNKYHNIIHDLKNIISNTHYALQIMMGPLLLSQSDNWRPFKPGINYLIKSYDVNKYGKNNIQLLHYCGLGAAEIAVRQFPEYFNQK
jgi:hypothetical protein